MTEDKPHRHPHHRLLCLMVATFLAGCGGGGGSAPPAASPPPTAPPTTPAPTTPTPPPPPPPASPVAAAATQTHLSVGYGYVLARRADGQVLAWGRRMLGGNGVPLAGSAARLVSGLANIRAVRSTTAHDGGQYEHSLVLGVDGQVQGWGLNGEIGALGLPRGNGSVVADAPVALAALGTAVQIEGCGGWLSAALRADGSVWILPATSPFSGEPGTATAAAISGLTATYLGRGLQGFGGSLSACHMHVVGQDGAVRLIDFGDTSSLAGYQVTYSVSLTVILPPVTEVHCSHLRVERHCLALGVDGRVWAWGNNAHGQLGDGSNIDRAIPVQVPGLAGITQIAVNEGASFAIDAGGALFSWGGSWNGQGSSQPPEAGRVPTALAGFEATREVAGGHQAACALKRDGTVWCWGVNREGLFGSDTLDEIERSPQQATGINLN